MGFGSWGSSLDPNSNLGMPEDQNPLQVNVTGYPEPNFGDTLPNIPNVPEMNQLENPNFTANGGGDTSWMNDIWNYVSGQNPGLNANQNYANALTIPALATAYKQWNDADKYGQTAQEASRLR